MKNKVLFAMGVGIAAAMVPSMAVQAEEAQAPQLPEESVDENHSSNYEE